MSRELSRFFLYITLLLPILGLADSGGTSLKSTAIPENATRDAARFLLINTGALDDVISLVRMNQIFMHGMDELAAGFSQQAKTAKGARNTNTDKRINEFTKKILHEVNQHRAEFEQQFSGQEPELQQLMETDNWLKASNYLAKIPRFQNKALPDLRTRLGDAAFTLWIEAALFSNKGKKGDGGEQNPVLTSLRNLRDYLNDFDPKLTEQRAQVARRKELFTAIRANDLGRVKTLIAEGVEIESSDSHAAADEVPLLVAVEAASLEMVALLRRHGAAEIPAQLTRALEIAADKRPTMFPVLLNDAKFPNEAQLNTALSDLADTLMRAQHYTELAMLLAAVGDADRLTRFEKPLLYEAIDRNDIGAARLFLKHGANPNTMVKTWGPLLGVAIRTKNPEMVQLLLSEGANPNPQLDKNSQTLLADLIDTSFDLTADQLSIADKLAAAGAQLSFDNGSEACRILIRHAHRIGQSAVTLVKKFNVDAQRHSDTDLGCLWQAIEQDDHSLAQWALKQGAYVAARNKEGETLLHRLARSSGELVPALIRQLVIAGVDPNSADPEANTPLHVAALYSKDVSLPVLFEMGADPNRYNQQGRLPFQSLMPDENGIPWIKEFVQHGQDMNAVVSNGETVFISFATYATAEQLNWFLDARREFDINAPDANGYTPLAHLLTYGKLDAARIVYKHGAKIDRGDLRGRTPLHYAASGGRLELLPVILDEMHADPNAVSYDGYNALDFAHSANHAEVEELLKPRVTGPFPDAAALQKADFENYQRYLTTWSQRKHLTSDVMLNIGYIYDSGQGAAQDYAEAMTWYRRAADQGNMLAQYNIGLLYRNGHGVKQDYAEAAVWYRKAAEKGYADAQNNLGALYNDGLGVQQNHGEAFVWIQKAAEQGFSVAQSNLAAMYANGQGTKKNIAKARQWYKKAAEQGDEEAAEALKKLSVKTKAKVAAQTD